MLDSHVDRGQRREDGREVAPAARDGGASVDLVACQDDAIAVGALRAFQAAPDVTRRWGVVPFLGIDGVPRTASAS